MFNVSTLKPTWSRKPILGALVAVFVILLLELLLRIGAFVWYDYSQFYLYHGFTTGAGKLGINPGTTNDGRHYKFPPNYVLRGAAGQSDETAAINSLGFRGPEFERTKPPGTFRVVCLGESSTFGFHNTDSETYPLLLGDLFRERPGSTKVEVINAGFPYYNSGSILSLLQAEILSLDPDILTVYSAYNDVHWPFEMGAVERFTSWLRDHSVTYLLMKETILKDEFGAMTNRRVDRKSFEAQTSRVVARYKANYEQIIAAARSNGIPIIFIKQPMTARYTHIKERNYTRTYEEEYKSIVRKLDANRKLSPVELQILVHHRLVDELAATARREHIELVDNIAILDRDRRLMASAVHLTGEANLNLAKALKPVIEKHLPEHTSLTSDSKSLDVPASHLIRPAVHSAR